MGLELHRLRYFVTIAQEGSFRRAAERLFLAQPSLSQQVRKLEVELNTPLFERLGRRVVLTPAGEAFLPYAQRALSSVEAGKRQVQEVLGLRGGRIAVGVLPTVGTRLLPPALVELQRIAPAVEVRLREESVSAELERLVELGELDLAIMRPPRTTHDKLVHRVIAREPLVLIVPPGHRLAERASVGIAELRDERFVAMKPGWPQHEDMLRLCRAAGFEPHVVVETCEVPIIRSLVHAGVGAAILPSMAVPPGARCSLLEAADAVRVLAVVWRDTGYVSPATELLLRLLTGG